MTTIPKRAAVIYASFKVKLGCLQCFVYKILIASNRNVLWLAETILAKEKRGKREVVNERMLEVFCGIEEELTTKI